MTWSIGLGRLRQTLRVAAGQDNRRALGLSSPCGLEPDARAAADHDHGLPEQRRLPSARASSG
jgi:hypothetical protein